MSHPSPRAEDCHTPCRTASRTCCSRSRWSRSPRCDLRSPTPSAPPWPTMTVCVRLPSVVVVVAPGRVVVVVAPAQPPALQLSQQLGTVLIHAEPPLGAVH